MDGARRFLSVLLLLGMVVGPIAMAEEASDSPKDGAASEPTAPGGKPPTPGQKGKLTNIKGVVILIDPSTQNIRVKEGKKEGNKEYTITLTERTVVTAGKMRKSASEIQPGDKIVARVSDEDGKLMARSIRLAQESKKGKKKPAPEAKASDAPEAKPVEPPQTPQGGTPNSSDEMAPEAGRPPD
jgi:translation initiation factor IF-1